MENQERQKRGRQVVGLLVYNTDNLQIKNKGEEKVRRIGAILAHILCSVLGLVVSGQKRKISTHTSSRRRDVGFM